MAGSRICGGNELSERRAGGEAATSRDDLGGCAIGHLSHVELQHGRTAVGRMPRSVVRMGITLRVGQRLSRCAEEKTGRFARTYEVGDSGPVRGTCVCGYGADSRARVGASVAAWLGGEEYLPDQRTPRVR